MIQILLPYPQSHRGKGQGGQASFTYVHNLGGLKQQEWILLYSWVSEVQNSPSVPRDELPLESPGENRFPCLFWPPELRCLVHVPWSIFKASKAPSCFQVTLPSASSDPSALLQ